MQIELRAAPLVDVDADALVVGRWEQEPLAGDAAELDRMLGGVIADVAGLAGGAELTGKRGDLAIFYTQGRLAARRVAVVGLGKREAAAGSTLREVSGAVARQLRDKNLKVVASALHRAAGSPARAGDADSNAAAVVEGALLGLWEPDSYKTASSRKAGLDALQVAEPDSKRADAVRNGVERGRIFAESSNFARTLTNEPPNDLPPSALAERARAMAAEVGLGYEALTEDEMFRLGMGGILAVSVGSENRARLVVLKHTPNPGDPVLALVGKGVTFDTGGISIKPREGMEAMKGDMAGAAAVIGAMRAIALLKAPVNVVGVAPCAENMPSGKAYRPGDVVRCMNGKTVEIISTDAEGRMLLADALTYAVRNLRAPRVVDVATLTGACVIALGNVASGAVTNNDEFYGAVRRAAETAGEKIWELPHYDEYREQIKSPIADLKNSGGRPAGAITAGLFLREFVDDTAWVHLDIAGPSETDSALPHLAKGPTGHPLRTLVTLAESLVNG